MLGIRSHFSLLSLATFSFACVDKTHFHNLLCRHWNTWWHCELEVSWFVPNIIQWCCSLSGQLVLLRHSGKNHCFVQQTIYHSCFICCALTWSSVKVKPQTICHLSSSSFSHHSLFISITHIIPSRSRSEEIKSSTWTLRNFQCKICAVVPQENKVIDSSSPLKMKRLPEIHRNSDAETSFLLEAWKREWLPTTAGNFFQRFRGDPTLDDPEDDDDCDEAAISTKLISALHLFWRIWGETVCFQNNFGNQQLQDNFTKGKTKQK